jgi:uncharacterized membrane protein YfcA
MIASIVLAIFWVGGDVDGAEVPVEGAMQTSSITVTVLAFFCSALAIAMIAVIAGIGGGVIFTPLMLAITRWDSLVVRGTGLIVAMFSGLISTGMLYQKRARQLKLCMTLTR